MSFVKIFPSRISFSILVMIVFSFSSGKTGEIFPFEKKEVLYQTTFDTDISEWILEPEPSNDHQAELKEGFLFLATNGGQTCWLNRFLEGNIAIEYDVTVPSEGVDHARLSDLNQYFMAVDPDAPRPDSLTPTNKYSGPDYYKKFRMYYCGMGVYDNQSTRFRRCDGQGDFPLEYECENQPCQIKSDTVMHVECIRFGNRILFRLNGKTIVDYQDSEVFKEGFFGFRNYKSAKFIHNLTVYRLGPKNTVTIHGASHSSASPRQWTENPGLIMDLKGRTDLDDAKGRLNRIIPTPSASFR